MFSDKKCDINLLHLITVHVCSWTLVCWQFKVPMLNFRAKHVKTQIYFPRENRSLNEFSTSSLHTRKQPGASDWKTLKRLEFLGRQKFYDFFKKSHFPKKWRQILKILQSVKLRPKYASFCTWTSRLYPTEQAQSILQTLNLSDQSFCLHSCTTKCTCVSPLHAMEIMVLLGH